MTGLGEFWGDGGDTSWEGGQERSLRGGDI